MASVCKQPQKKLLLYFILFHFLFQFESLAKHGPMRISYEIRLHAIKNELGLAHRSSKLKWLTSESNSLPEKLSSLPQFFAWFKMATLVSNAHKKWCRAQNLRNSCKYAIIARLRLCTSYWHRRFFFFLFHLTTKHQSNKVSQLSYQKNDSVIDIICSSILAKGDTSQSKITLVGCSGKSHQMSVDVDFGWLRLSAFIVTDTIDWNTPRNLTIRFTLFTKCTL